MTGPRHSRYGYRPRSRARLARRFLMLGGLGAVALGAGAVLVAAALGPERVASRVLVVPEPPDVVWHVLTDLDNLVTWRRGITRVERLPDFGGQLAWMEYRGEASEAVRVSEARPPSRLVTERVGSTGSRASWSWEVVRTARGSELTVTRRVSVEPLVRRVASRLSGQTRREVDRVLADLTLRLQSASRLRTAALNR